MAGMQTQWPRRSLGNSKKDVGEINLEAVAKHVTRINKAQQPYPSKTTTAKTLKGYDS